MDCSGGRLLTVMRLMHFDSGTGALAQLRYGFTPSAYESAHMHHRGEQPVPNLYVRLPRHMLQLHRQHRQSEFVSSVAIRQLKAAYERPV